VETAKIAECEARLRAWLQPALAGRLAG
jgi:hypothetical protein